MRKPENQQPGTTAKLEGRYKLRVFFLFCFVLFCFCLIMYMYTYTTYRFGKLLWFNLPEDVLASDEPWNVKTFAQFAFSDAIHSHIFDTE